MRGILLVAAVLLLQACATSRNFTFESEGLFQNPSESILLNGNFATGWSDRGRNLAVIRSAFSFAGEPFSRDEIPRISGDTVNGFVDKLSEFGLSRNLWVSGAPGSREHLESVLAGGTPVVVLIENPSSGNSRLQPWLVHGFDADAGFFLIHEGRSRSRSIRYDDFARAWQRTRNFMITVVAPDKADWLLNLAERKSLAACWLKQRKWERADDAYRDAENIAPGDLSLLYGRARVWEEAEVWTSAANLYRQILGRDPVQSRAANNLAHVLLASGGSLDEAQKFARRATTIEPGNAVYLATLGSVHEKLGEVIEATACFEKAHHHAAELSLIQQREIIASLVRVYNSCGNPHLARQVAAEYASRDPGFDPFCGAAPVSASDRP